MFLNNNKKIILFLICFLLLLVLVNIFLFVQRNKCTEIKLIETSLEIERAARNIIGINADTDSLKLGKVSPLSGVKRSIMINSSYDAGVEVEVESTFSSWFKIEPQTFFIKKNQVVEVMFDVFVPENASTGNYSGKVKFCFKEKRLFS